MEQANAVVGEQIFDLVEEFDVMTGSDMFEHADRHDAVERIVLLAVIQKLKRYIIHQAGVCGAALADFVLLGGQGNAGDFRAGLLRQV